MEQMSGFRSRRWEDSYWSPQVRADGTSVDILHDFYIPALSLAHTYDRLTGYFSSSALMTAEKGYAALVAAGGKVRIIAGVDLNNPGDFEALLEGEQYAENVLHDIGLAGTFPLHATAQERLSWSIASGFISFRLAIVIHPGSGLPVSFGDQSDGYVHAKMALFTDLEGNSLFMSGSLNESRKALEKNAENIEVECSWMGGQRHKSLATYFDDLWSNRNPHVRVLTATDAHREGFIEKNGATLSVRCPFSKRARMPQVSPVPSEKDALNFLFIREAPFMQGGEFLGIETAPIEPWTHQRAISRSIVGEFPLGRMVCDGVGLGKTFSTGLALRSLIISGIARRVLLSVPAGLASQWHEALAKNLLIMAARTTSASYTWNMGDARPLPIHSLFEPNVNLISTSLISRKENQDAITHASEWDVVLVDEGHFARRTQPDRKEDTTSVRPEFNRVYKTFSRLCHKAKQFLLATATPIQLHQIEGYDLARLTGRLGIFQDDPELCDIYYELVRALSGHSLLNIGDIDFLHRMVKQIKKDDPVLYKRVLDDFFNKPERSALRDFVDKGDVKKANIIPLQRALFQLGPLARCMSRHGKPHLRAFQRENPRDDRKIPEREVMPVEAVPFSLREKAVFDALETYVYDLREKLEEVFEGDEKAKVAVGFYLTFLRRRFSSSHYALLQTLKRRIERLKTLSEKAVDLSVYDAWGDDGLNPDVEADSEDKSLDEEEIAIRVPVGRTKVDIAWEIERIEVLIVSLEELGNASSKRDRFMQIVRSRTQDGKVRQMITFSQFYDTARDVFDHLVFNSQATCAIYSGRGCWTRTPQDEKDIPRKRDDIRRMFVNGDIDILICTDAAAEGLNLQTSDYLVQYDLPWNPSKAEQRIGRIDRIGSTHDRVQVVNLCYQEGVEVQVYGVLAERIECSGCIGAQENIILPLDQADFEDLAECHGEIAREACLERLQQKALSRLDAASRRAELVEMSAEDLCYVYCKRMKNNICAPLQLSDIWSAVRSSDYLMDIGCTFDDDTQTVMLNGIPGIANGRHLTVSREGWEDRYGKVGFLSYGDTDFKILVDHMAMAAREGSYELDRSSIRPGTHAPLVSLKIATPEGMHPVYTYSDLAFPNESQAPAKTTDFMRNQEVVLKHREADDAHMTSIRYLLRAYLADKMEDKPQVVRKKLRNAGGARTLDLKNVGNQSFALIGVVGQDILGSTRVKLPPSGNRILAAAMGRLNTGRSKEVSMQGVYDKLRNEKALDYPVK
jgi:Helicase conserved C-terminal domain